MLSLQPVQAAPTAAAFAIASCIEQLQLLHPGGRLIDLFTAPAQLPRAATAQQQEATL